MQSVLVRYGVERLLYGLGESASRDRFVLKGAVLFSHWNGSPHRPTRGSNNSIGFPSGSSI
jgi:hypothetical protein